MRRDEPELPYTRRARRDEPRRPRAPESDPAVTFIDGRGFRRETSRHDPDNTIRPDEQKVLAQRAREAAERRLADIEANLAAAVRVGAALKVLKGEG